MAYSTPELLLVGAARNLVLEGSIYPELKNGINCDVGYPTDVDSFIEYETIETW
jgi:hypothetical protein